MGLRDADLQYALIMGMIRSIEYANKALFVMLENELSEFEMVKYIDTKFLEIAGVGEGAHRFLEEKIKENPND